MTDLRNAAIVEAARAAGAVDASDIPAFISASETLAPAEAVAALKSVKPYLFTPPPARTLSPAEYDAALRRAGANPATIRRHR